MIKVRPKELFALLTNRLLGFSDVADHWRGTYDHSWTWFEVAIIPFQSYKSSGNLRYPPPRRHLQSNAHAVAEFKVHKNTWDARDMDVERQEWLRFLQPGDVVQLIPRALYRAWVNHIKRAEIEIFGGAPTSLAIRSAFSPLDRTAAESSTDSLL
jgi:hypothetical protein